MRDLLFVYGTLRDPDLLAAVLARPLNGAAIFPAVAPGHRVVLYPSRTYPALVRAPGANAEGLVLADLTPFELDLLDAYEGAEYRRGRLPVILDEELHEAFAYLPASAIPADAAPWRLTQWQEAHKSRALVSERAAAEALRIKLLAIRPH